MNKKYQVFVSSTYLDLIEERQAVIKALLNVDCIPSGMELFPATDTSQWEYIKRVIKECDYYILLIAARYGSVEKESGLSYTEKEYRYAREVGKPTICFYLADNLLEFLPAEKKERELEGQVSLKNFKSFARENLSAPFTNPDNLAFNVVNSINNLKISTPTVGWIRGDSVIIGDSAEEILKLKREIEILELRSQEREEIKMLEIREQLQNILTVNINYVIAESHNIIKDENIIVDISFYEIILEGLPLFYEKPTFDKFRNKFAEHIIKSKFPEKITIENYKNTYLNLLYQDSVKLTLKLKNLELINQHGDIYNLTEFGEKIIVTLIPSKELS